MTNVRRKGDLLYIPYPNAVFPNRCIKTNQPIESADYAVSFIVPPWLQRGYQDSHIKMVVLYKILHDSKRVKFKIGLSSESRKRRKSFLICSYLMSGIIGTVCLVGTFSVESEIFRAVCVTGVVVSMVLWMQLPFLGWLRLVSFPGDKIVVSGAPREFLDTLAEFYDQLLIIKILSVNYDVFPPEILGSVSNEGGKLTDNAVLQCKDCHGSWSVGSTSSQIDGDTLVALMEVGTCEHLKPGWSLESVVQVRG